MQRSASYSLIFATLVCFVCAVVVSLSAVSLKDLQDTNADLDKQKNVLIAAGLATEDEVLTAEEVAERFAPIESVVIDLETGEELEDVDPSGFDQLQRSMDPTTSRSAPENPARVQRLPNEALVYKMTDDQGLQLLILPVEGKGLWSTLYGFLALDRDLTTIRGITFYQHKETPGLGGEVDNPKWKGLWPGRKAFNENDELAIQVIRGQAGTAQDDPHRVDGLSGATMTSRGVSSLVRFWLGEHGFGTYVEKLKNEGQVG